MNIAICVQSAPAASPAATSALRFARAALAGGHTIDRVFFFHDGVLTANRLEVPPEDEPSPLAGWVQLSAAHDFELAVCVAAAQKRGIVDEDARARYELPAASLHPAFVAVGLGQLVDAVNRSDRLVTFA
jgi:tRNA 2-thiouridine synthesizing protein D